MISPAVSRREKYYFSPMEDKINLRSPQRDHAPVQLEDIKQEFIQELKQRVHPDFKAELSRLLNLFLKKLKDDEVFQYNNYKVQTQDFQTIARRTCKLIKTAVKAYLNGDLATCYDQIKNCLIGGAKGTANDINYCWQGEGTYFYRIRTKASPYTYPAKEMFHVPFDMRNKLKTCRYSIPGFPCLYLGRSIYGCWEEMRQPALKDFCVSALQPTEELKLLDLRYDQQINSESKLTSYLSIFPLILACSVPVKSDEDSFKPEYIIPQLTLQTILKYRPQTWGADGIIYTSTRKNSANPWNDKPELWESIALPVYKSQPQGLCPQLSKKFKITDSICYEHELIHKRIPYTPLQNTDYADSPFGLLEKCLQEETFQELT